MRKIIDFEVFDIIECTDGIIASKKETVNEGSYKVSFFRFDLTNGRLSPVTKDFYQLNKFGENYNIITSEIGDYVSCEAALYKNGSVAVVYPTGETGFFDKHGRNVWTGDLFYRDCPINGAVPSGTYFWTTVPLQNSIISYSIPHKKFSMRIGSENSPTFNEPVSLSIYGSEMFVCNAGSNKIRSVNLKTFLVNDFRQFEEPVYKYVRSGIREFVVLASGVYLL